MKIENVDALKQWLVSVLNPIFEGDPNKLALYIVALAKKVENDQASRDRCINDLEVFLEANTNNFVDNLFETLVSKKYLSSAQSVITTTATVNSTTNSQPQTANSENGNNSNKTDLNDNLSNRKKDYYDSSSRYQNDRERDRSRRFNNYDDSRRTSQRHSADHYSNRGGNGYRSRLSRDYQEIDSNRNRSRSRSSKTRHKNRSRNRTHRGASSSSSSTSSSPSLNVSSRRFDGERKNAYKRSYSRSRSHSPRNRSNNDENESSSKKERCRDFDEKGFCTRAELCPYDHGEVVIAPLMSSNATNTLSQQPLNSNINIDQQDLNAPNQIMGTNNFPMNNQMYNPNSNDMYQMPRHQRNNNQQRRNNINNGMQNKSGGAGLLPMPSSFPGQQQQQGRFNNQRNNNQIGNNFNNNNNTQQLQANMTGNGNQNDLYNLPLQQQRQIMSNRPRNLVSIVTSMQQEDQDQTADQSNFNNQSNQQQRGLKRSYYNNNFNNGNQQQFVSNNPDQNFAYQNNQNFNQQPALLPTPTPLQQQPPITQQQVNQGNANQPFQASLNKTPGFNQGNNLQSHNNQNTTIILRKVPIDLNKVEKMRQHFTKFGQILDIKCQYENNSDATLIQFANNQQAFNAYKCPQSVFNNRFIRIYWLSNHQKQQNQQQQIQSNQSVNSDEPLVKRPVKDRLSFNSFDPNDQSDKDIHSANEIKNKENKQQKTSLNSMNLSKSTSSLVKTAFNDQTDENLDQSVEMNKSIQDLETGNEVGMTGPNNQNLTNNFSTLSINKSFDPNNKKINYENAAKAIQDENQKKVQMLKLEVKQKARELIEKQIKDQKLLLQKFEQAKTVEEKTQILELVKQLSHSIEKEKEILNNKNFDTPSTPPFNASPFTFQKVPVQKNLIIPPPVHHLKLNNKRLNNTNFLKSQANIANHPIKTTPKQLIPPQAIQAQFSYSRIDNRPKNLMFTGVENVQEKTNLINFVKALGCQIETINDLSNESVSPISFSINFATRKDAEIALAKCSASLNGKSISITWSKAENSEQKTQLKEKEPAVEDSTSNEETKIESKINSLLSADEYDDDSKSKEKQLDTNESTNESEQVTELEQKEFVDALFDDSTNYENILS